MKPTGKKYTSVVEMIRDIGDDALADELQKHIDEREQRIETAFRQAMECVENLGEPYTEHEKQLMGKAFRLGWYWGQPDDE